MSGYSPPLAATDQPARIGNGLDPMPAWVDAAWEVAEGCRRAFSRGPSFTVGLEEELMLLDPTTLLPANAIEEALVRLEDDRFTHELRSAQLELRTNPHLLVSDACRELGAARMLAVDRLAGLARIAAAGVHPVSTLPIEITDRERYRGIAAGCAWAVREGLPCGLHVHVAIKGANRALAIYNAARGLLPELAALTANSPYLAARDSGLESSRLKLNEAFPRSGIPPAFRSLTDYAEFVAWGMTGGHFPDQSFLWWDLRLHPLHGTLEFRVPDAQTCIEEAAAVAAVCQALVASLAARYDAGGELRVHSSHRIAENRWRAVRDGLEGALVDLDTGVPVAARTRVGVVLAALEPVAEALGSRNELLAAWTLLEENGAERQRRLACQHGLDEVVRVVADETGRANAAPRMNPGESPGRVTRTAERGSPAQADEGIDPTRRASEHR
ncbi:MAG TPA: YbdK family carboxylate-amine ligase [Gaiellaceae bacterium]|jgi:carboxylate-amine ligase